MNPWTAKWRGPVLVAAALTGAAIIVAAFVGIRAYVRSVSTWSGDSAFGTKVADAVGEAVADGIGEALERVGAELRDTPVGDEYLTVDELARLRNLYIAGGRDQLRRELSSRFTQSELEELWRRLDSLAKARSTGSKP